ncbi:MAG TPA: hypothetical protein VGO62_19030, partial [Myxococcota bacterium]
THIPRAAVHAKKSSFTDVDDAAALLASRPGGPPPPVAAAAVAPVAPPVAAVAPVAPQAARDASIDPEATLVHNAEDIARIAAEIAAREEQQETSGVTARGAVRPLE